MVPQYSVTRQFSHLCNATALHSWPKDNSGIANLYEVRLLPNVLEHAPALACSMFLRSLCSLCRSDTSHAYY